MINENKPIDIIVCQPLNGREAPTQGNNKQSNLKNSVLTPLLPFENEIPKIRRNPIPIRNPTSSSQTINQKQTKNIVGSYAIKFADSTWGHSIPSTSDHYASRSEVIDILNKYDTQIQSITGSNDVEIANQLQCFTDLLLDQLSSQLRSECVERSMIVERARESYASVFTILQDDGERAKKRIKELENQNTSIEENLTKVIDTSTERVNEARENCARQIAEMKAEMDAKIEESEASTKQYKTEKENLEKHVNALHSVFLEFQSDSVHMKLEDLKQKHEQLERKIKNKDTEISKLKSHINKLQKQLQDEENKKNLTEQANNELRKKMQIAITNSNRLQRKLELQNMDGTNDKEEEEEKHQEVPDLPSKDPLVDNQFVPHQFGRKKRSTNSPIDPSPFIHLFHKLEKVCDRLVDISQRLKVSQEINLDEGDIEHTEILLSGIPTLMVRELEKKVDESLRILETIETIDFKNLGSNENGTFKQNEPRFLQFIRLHNIDNNQSDLKTSMNIFTAIRQIFQAKYLSDKWHQRMGKKPIRFPEFIVSYYSKEDDNLFTSLQRSARLWRIVQKSKSLECKLFTKFLIENYTVDELTFFLEIRYALLGLPSIDEDAPPLINIPFVRCKNLLQKVLGAFSTALQTITWELEKLVSGDYIDYAAFSTVLLKFYKGERRKKRSAISYMFQSNQFSRGSISLDLESFTSMIQSLGVQSSIEEIFEIYRESILMGNGEITIDSLLKAMDNLSIHFYSIDTPLFTSIKSLSTELTRQQLLTHWIRFNSWFDGFRRPLTNFDSWLRIKLVNQVRIVDQIFKNNNPIQTLYTEYRNLLDFFQFSLEVLARGQKEPLPSNKSERHLQLLENLIDLLITFLLENSNDDLGFSEAL